ncbi:MAG TPA: cytochrome P450 [Pseudonocardia sp.]
MTDHHTVPSPFRHAVRPLDAPDPARACLRTAGPLVQLDAPAGGPVWVVTDAALARQVLADSSFAKDPALAPPGWDRRSAGLEPSAAEQASVTTLDGSQHAALRKTFAPLFSAQRMHSAYGRMRAIAHRLLADSATEPVDLVADFSIRYPLTILCDLLGVPAERVDDGISACRLMHVDYPAHVGEAMTGFAALADAALACDGGLARELAERLPPGSGAGDLGYHVFTLLYAGQLTTDPAIGFLVARLLNDSGTLDHAALVRDTLAEHPPAPFSLWRFTTTDLELAGTALPARSPVLVDIEGINSLLGPDEKNLTFGAGPHYCIGAQLAQLELQALAETLTADYPDARLLVPYADLRLHSPGGIMGSRLTTLPIVLTPNLRRRAIEDMFGS